MIYLKIIEASLLFLVKHCNALSHNVNPIPELAKYKPAETFEKFLEINRISVYEQVIREAV